MKPNGEIKGFTLVELIVVIAILGILAGISVPVYSGYIEKAGEAADLQLLGAVNTAYAAACAARGVDPTGIVGMAELTGETGAKTVARISAVGAGVDSDALNTAFMALYGENRATPFKKYTSLGYDRANGVFVDGAKEYTFETTLGTVTVSAAQMSAYQASTFSDIGTKTLTDNIANLVNRVLTSDSLAKFIYNNSDGMQTGYSDFLASLGLSAPDVTGLSEEKAAEALENWNNQQANALVLYTAHLSKDLDAESIAATMASGNTITLTGSTTDQGKSIAASALMYAMMTSYANSDYAVASQTSTKETVKNGDTMTYNGVTYTKIKDYANAKYGEGNYSITTYGTTRYIDATISFDPLTYYKTTSGSMTGLTDVGNMYETFASTDGFKQYMAAHGSSDVAAYITAMNIINENAEKLDSDALSTVLSNGYMDTNLNNMLATILGS